MLVATGRKGSDGLAVGPVGAVVTTSIVEASRIDPAFEETLERGVDRSLSETAFVEREETESRDVTFVERKRMAQRNRAIVERVVIDQAEDGRRALAIAAIPLQQSSAIDRGSGNYSVPRFSCSRSIETKSALKLPLPNERLPLR